MMTGDDMLLRQHHCDSDCAGLLGCWMGAPDVRDGLSCHYCGSPAEAWDHVFPRAYGGSDSKANLVPSCTSCNSRKGSLPAVALGGEGDVESYLNAHGFHRDGDAWKRTARLSTREALICCMVEDGESATP